MFSWLPLSNSYTIRAFASFSRRPPGLSPFRQRAAKNMFKNYIFNGYRRLSGELVYWSIPFAFGTYHSDHMSLSLLPSFRISFGV